MVGEDATRGPLEDVNVVLKDSEKLKKALKKMRDNDKKSKSKSKLKDLIEQIREEDKAAKGLKSLRGLGGGYGLALLAGAEKKVGADGDFDPGTTSIVSLSGQITDYSYDPVEASGLLVVKTTSTVSDGSSTVSTDYIWTVEIKQHGYNVIWHSGDRDDPFPGTLAFDAPMLDRIEQKGFNAKLYASGPGRIKIQSVIKDGQPVGPGDPLLKADPDSCIDMMFKVADNANIPTTLQELGTHGYCLGRCKHPALINTP